MAQLKGFPDIKVEGVGGEVVMTQGDQRIAFPAVFAPAVVAMVKDAKQAATA